MSWWLAGWHKEEPWSERGQRALGQSHRHLNISYPFYLLSPHPVPRTTFPGPVSPHLMLGTGWAFLFFIWCLNFLDPTQIPWPKIPERTSYPPPSWSLMPLWSKFKSRNRDLNLNQTFKQAAGIVNWWYCKRVSFVPRFCRCPVRPDNTEEL